MAGAEIDGAVADKTLRTLHSVRAHQVVLVLGLSLTFVAYCGSMRYEFVYDDHGLIVSNPLVHAWRFVPRYFTQHEFQSVVPGSLGNYYRPLVLLWLRSNHMLFGLNPWGWHLTTVLAHLGVTLSVYYLASRLVGDPLLAAMASMIFGVHPVHVEGVDWVTGVTEPLLALLFISTFLCYLKVWDHGLRSEGWRVASLVLYLAALFSRETALLFPVFVFAYEALFRQSKDLGRPSAGLARRIRNAILSSTPYLAITPVYLLSRVLALNGFSHTLTPLPLSTVIYTAPSLLWFYLKRLVWPVNMSVHYNMPYVSNPALRNFAMPLAGIVVTGLILWFWAARPESRVADGRHGSRSRMIAFASAWVLVPLLPVLDVRLMPTLAHVHDHYLYLPSVGFVMMVALLLRSIKVGQVKLSGQPAIQFALLAVIACSSTWTTIVEGAVWSDDLSLYARASRVWPESGSLKEQLAGALQERGHYEEAIAIYRQLFSRRPDLWEANYNLGFAYYRAGKFDEAEPYLRRAVAINPRRAAGHLRLGLTLLKMGRVEEAAESLDQAVKVEPHAYGVHFARGMVMELQGNWTGALVEFKDELAIAPEEQAAREQIVEIERRLGSR